MASEVVKRMRDRRVSVWESAKAIAERAADENRALDAEESRAWDELNAELAALDKRIDSHIKGEQRAKEQEEKLAALDGGRGRSNGSSGNGAEVVPAGAPGSLSQRNHELREWATGQSPTKYFDVRRDPNAEYRDLVKSGATTGGNLVPTTFYDRLVEHMIDTAAILQLDPTVLNTDSGEVIQVPKTTAHSVGAVMSAGGNLGEGVAIPESDPAFGQTSLTAHKYGILMEVSTELLTDAGVDLEGYLARQAGRALGNALGAHLVAGTGTNQPRGVLADTTAGATGAVGTTTSFGAQSTAGMGGDALIALFYSVIAPYRNSSSAGWLMNDATMGKARLLKDSAGNYVFQPSLVAGTPDTLMGKPVVTDPNMPVMAANAKSVIFGDWSAFFVRIVNGVRFERSDDFRFGNDLVAFRALLRADSTTVDTTGALKHFANSAT